MSTEKKRRSLFQTKKNYLACDLLKHEQYTVQYKAELLSVTRLWRCGDGSGNQTRDQLIQLVKNKAQGIEPKHRWFWQSDQGPAHPAGQDQSTR